MYEFASTEEGPLTAQAQLPPAGASSGDAAAAGAQAAAADADASGAQAADDKAAPEDPQDPEIWWNPPHNLAELGAHFVSEFVFPGLNAPLRGDATKKHKKAWAQPQLVPEAVVSAARSASHTRQKQFFSYRVNERALALQALAAGARKSAAKPQAKKNA